MSSKKLLIVGTGITGAISASLIKSVANDVQIIIWDKAMKTGGRMNTTSNPFHRTHTADLGAQYITHNPELAPSHIRFYEELIEANILKPLDTAIEGMRTMPPGILNYVTPNGISSIVQHFLEKSKASIMLGQKLESLKINDCGTKWLASTNTTSDIFDAVLLTMPIPQILEMQGDIQKFLGKDKRLKEKMESVVYTSRYALALFYNGHLDFFNNLPWSAKYFVESDIVFVAIDNKKRGTDHLPSVIVHTSCSFAARNLELNRDVVQEKIIEVLQQQMPDFPIPDIVICHKWKYSQVQYPYPGTQGCLVLQTSPFLICAGDGFTNSSFDGCIEASQDAASEIIKYFTN